jgi:hypothetical protein
MCEFLVFFLIFCNLCFIIVHSVRLWRNGPCWFCYSLCGYGMLVIWSVGSCKK